MKCIACHVYACMRVPRPVCAYWLRKKDALQYPSITVLCYMHRDYNFFLVKIAEFPAEALLQAYGEDGVLRQLCTHVPTL